MKTLNISVMSLAAALVLSGCTSGGDLEDDALDSPGGSQSDDGRVEIPDVAGQAANEAREQLDELGLSVTYEAEDGTVFNGANWEAESTSPVSGEVVDGDSEVVLNVVRPEEAATDDETGSPEEEAEEDAPLPEGLDAQSEAITEVRDFEGAYVYNTDGNITVEVEVGPGWSESTMCRGAREQTIRGLQFFRDNVEEDFNNVGFSYFTRSEPDATGDSSILSMAGVYYNQETVQAIQDDSVMIGNVWEAADDGGRALVCERAE